MKNAIVTGASNGIGLEISKKLTENNDVKKLIYSFLILSMNYPYLGLHN